MVEKGLNGPFFLFVCCFVFDCLLSFFFFCDQNKKKIFWIVNPTSGFMDDASQYGVNVGVRGSNPHFLVMVDHLESRERVLFQAVCDGVGPGPVIVSLTGYNDKLSPTGVVVKHHHYSSCKAVSGLIIGTKYHIHIEYKHLFTHWTYKPVQTRAGGWLARLNRNIAQQCTKFRKGMGYGVSLPQQNGFQQFIIKLFRIFLLQTFVFFS